MDYAFTHNGRAYTPNKTHVAPSQVDAHNDALEAAELEAWAKAPDRFSGYVVRLEMGTHVLQTWRGKFLGRVYMGQPYRNNLGARIQPVTVRGSNGATYHGRYGSDWAQLVRLRRSSSKREA